MSRSYPKDLPVPRRALRRAFVLGGLLAPLALGGCLRRPPPDLSESVRLQYSLQELLREDESTPGYHEIKSRIQDMGPEVDAVLTALARERAVNTTVRANALILLAERHAPSALATLELALAPAAPSRLRAAAVLGLQRLAPTSADARRLVRSALTDPSRNVRLNALTALDVADVEAMRALLEKERDSEVRQVAMQLISISEARGAPLASDQRGALRTTATGLDPQLVFRPGPVDPLSGVSIGDLRLELPGALDVPLTSTAEAMGGVVPAFFSADRARVVFETEGEIRVIDIPSRATRAVGPGLAPRVVPFADHFVFLRERARTPIAGGQAMEIRYGVFQADFEGGAAVEIGELRAETRGDRPTNYTPVRRMVVAETPEGAVLRGENITTFVLPGTQIDPAAALPAASPREAAAG